MSIRNLQSAIESRLDGLSPYRYRSTITLYPCLEIDICPRQWNKQLVKSIRKPVEKKTRGTLIVENYRPLMNKLTPAQRLNLSGDAMRIAFGLESENNLSPRRAVKFALVLAAVALLWTGGCGPSQDEVSLKPYKNIRPGTVVLAQLRVQGPWEIIITNEYVLEGFEDGAVTLRGTNAAP